MIANMNVKENIIQEYLPLVKFIASKVMIGKSNLDFDDIVSSGTIGLIDAANKFDPTKGIKFSTYASIRIRGAMIDELRRNSPISKGAMEKLNKYNSFLEDYRNKNGDEPSLKIIAKNLGITKDDVLEIENNINYLSVVSLDSLIFSDENKEAGSISIKDDNSLSPEMEVEKQEAKQILEAALNTLNEKDKLVLQLYYHEELTLKEIGKVLEISESRVSQIHSRALSLLRGTMQKLSYQR